MQKTNPHYNSKDFYLSGFLVASGELLINFWRTDAITTFQFEQTDELDKLITQYYGMNATVNPVIYGQSLKNLKSIIYSNDKYNQSNSPNRTSR